MVDYTRIHNKRNVTQRIYNDGMNEGHLQFEMNTLLFDGIRNRFDLIDVNRGYPQDNIQEIDLSLDVVVLKYEDFQKLIKNRI